MIFDNYLRFIKGSYLEVYHQSLHCKNIAQVLYKYLRTNQPHATAYHQIYSPLPRNPSPMGFLLGSRMSNYAVRYHQNWIPVLLDLNDSFSYSLSGVVLYSRPQLSAWLPSTWNIGLAHTLTFYSHSQKWLTKKTVKGREKASNEAFWGAPWEASSLVQATLRELSKLEAQYAREIQAKNASLQDTKRVKVR